MVCCVPLCVSAPPNPVILVCLAPFSCANTASILLLWTGEYEAARLFDCILCWTPNLCPPSTLSSVVLCRLAHACGFCNCARWPRTSSVLCLVLLSLQIPHAICRTRLSVPETTLSVEGGPKRIWQAADCDAKPLQAVHTSVIGWMEGATCRLRVQHPTKQKGSSRAHLIAVSLLCSFCMCPRACSSNRWCYRCGISRGSFFSCSCRPSVHPRQYAIHTKG